MPNTKQNKTTTKTTLLALSLAFCCFGLFGSQANAAITTSTVSPSDVYFEPAVPLGADGSSFMQPFTSGSQWTAGDNAVNTPVMDGYNSMYSIPAPAKPCIKRTVNSVLLKSSLTSGDVAPIGIGFMDATNPGTAVGTNFVQEPQPSITINPDFHFGLHESNGSELTFEISPTTPKTYDQLKIIVGIDDKEGRNVSLIYKIEAFDITVTDDSSACPNTPPTISPSSATITSSTTSGSTVVLGSALGASDTDGDTLSYSITAGNGGGYFAINPSTGNITTTQTNIPVGTYALTVQVDDGNGGVTSAVVTITVSAEGAAGVLAKTGENLGQIWLIASTVALLGLTGIIFLMNRSTERSGY